MPIWIGLLTAGIGAGASLYGSGQQLSGEKNAIAAQERMFGIAQNELQPYISAGQDSLAAYQKALPSLTTPFTAATLPSTPGYQFTLNQGQKSTQNSFAAQGLGSSGAALKGAADYTTGLAQNTYNQQLQNYLAQNQQIGSLLLAPAQLGESAAGSLSGAAVGTGQGIGSSFVGMGNALAGGAVGGANALSGGANNALQYSLLQKLLGGSGVNYSGLSGPAWGGGNMFTDSWGGSPDNPLSGLTGADYG